MSYYKHRSASARPSSAGSRHFAPSKRPNRNTKRGVYINPSRFINRAVTVADTVIYEPQHTFLDFGFSEQLQRNIDAKGYTAPTPIQDQAIELIMQSKDVVGLANTGTGKTAAFALPIIDKLAGRAPFPTVVIMAPTRELAMQIDDEFRSFSKDMRLYSALVVGGANIERQIREVKRQPHVIIGTPGRLKDLMKRGVLRLEGIQCLVLDEADRMLDMGFINDVRNIVQAMPRERQTLFFSATMTAGIRSLIGEFLNEPTEISVRTADTSELVDQDVVYASSKEEKIEKLFNMLSEPEFEKLLIFGETKHGVQRLSDHLEKSGIASVAIHGNKSQSQRQRALKSFKENKARVMVATDVAARGLDIPNVTHVINFDQPATYEDYVHRIGRTGRGSARGSALTFVSKNA